MHGTDSLPSFETAAQEGGLLRMRAFILDRPKSGRDARGPKTPVPPQSIQREHEQVARRFEIVVLDGVQVATAALHRDILLGADRIGDGRALERRAEIEAP